MLFRMFSRGVGSLKSRFIKTYRFRSLSQQNQFRLGEIKDGKIVETVFPHKTHALNMKGTRLQIRSFSQT